MSARTPVTTAADLDTLDTDEIVEGYRDGRGGEPEPGDNRSRAYWHGWRNGMMDSQRMKLDAASGALISDCRATGWFKRNVADPIRALHLSPPSVPPK